MKISIILPTYNRGHNIHIALNSLIKQNYPPNDFEIIVVDNNSNDNTKSVVSDYIKRHAPLRISYIFEPRQGLVYARHKGAEYAQYEILAYCDDDGIYDECWLLEISRVFSYNSDICAVGGKIVIKWDEEPPDWVVKYEPLLGKIDYDVGVILPTGYFINGGNFSIKKDILYRLGGFNPDQIGDWLIGDGETGLCRKLHEAKCPIGWSSKALMEHYQIVKKNATKQDIKRRFINNGVGIPYRIYVIERKGIIGLALNLFKAFLHMCIWTLKMCLGIVIRKDTATKYEATFEYYYHWCQFPYTWRIMSDQKFRNELLKDNWM
ncbi:glycosyl transferase [Sporomusaceae bacterium FL31]|nr:glycosyl transferase [Sporomusaceae bacterium FL31]GCE33905.1 glycosyl transferase [Sporomusaceae bacterium]